jgi:hypothetical protein
MRPNLRAFLVWLGPAMVVGIAVARVSVWVQPHFSPMIVFPILIGAALGAILLGLVQLARLNDIRFAVAGTIFVALICAAAEHGFFYLDFLARESLSRQKKMFEAGLSDEEISPVTFAQYMRWQGAADRQQELVWIGNAALMAAAAVGVVVWYMKTRGPFHETAGTNHPHSSPLPTSLGPAPGEGTQSP